jgi:DNA-binding transcriptional regulator YhcF (GntR family)
VIVSVDPDSPVPVFEQLRSQIELLIVSGQLAPGQQLPVIRHLAADLGLARGTVAKVYEQLARQGLVTTSGRHGTRVTLSPKRDAPTHAQRAEAALQEAAANYAAVARRLDLTRDQAHEALDRALQQPAAL